jgi:hypothetical protein
MNSQQLYQWNEQVARDFPVLGKWQAKGLAVFSAGVVLAERCTLSKVAEKLPMLGKADSLERRLQRWVANPRLDMGMMSRCWIEAVVRQMVSNEWILLVDETKLGNHLSAMVVGVAYEGSCIPLVWRCYNPEQYPREGQVQMIVSLVEQVVRCLPTHYRVMLQADRGIGTSPDLIEAIEGMGIYFLFRVQGTTRLRLADGHEVALKDLAQVGQVWSGSGQVFKKHGWLQAHVRVVQHSGYHEMWCLVTNDPHLNGVEYAIRYWQEASFRDLKSDGWHWQRSHVWQPDHAQRLLFVLVLAYAWVLTHGKHVRQAAPHIRAMITRGKRQVYSLFREGLRFMARLVYDQQPLYLSLYFAPDRGMSKTVVS